MESESASTSRHTAWSPEAAAWPAPPSGPGAAPVEFRLVRGREGLSAIRGDWLRLTRSLPFKRFFHLYHWYWSYLDALEQAPERVCFFMAYREGAPIGVLPLKQITRRFRGIPLRALEVPRHPHLCLADVVFPPLWAEPAVWPDFRRFLHASGLPWDVILLCRVPSDAHLWSLLKGTPYLSLPQGRCDYFVGDTDYAQFAQGFSKNFRANLRKAHKRMEESGQVEYIVARQPAELARAFPRFLAVEASGWKGEDGAQTAIKLDPRLTRFYRNLIEYFGPQQACEISTLELDGRCIAARFFLVVDDTRYSLKIAYDEAYARLAPGKLLFEADLKRTLGEGRDLNLASDAPWHTDWRPWSYPVSNIYIFNHTPLGAAVSALFKVKRLFKERTSA